MANGSDSEGYSPLWYAVGAVILIALTMGAVVTLKPLQFTPPVAAPCEEAACEHGAPAAGGPEGVSHAHETAPAAHGE